jgi:hypothetical protein
MLEKVPRVGMVRSGPYLVAKPSQVAVYVARTPCPLRRPRPVGVGLVGRDFGSGRFFLCWSPSLSSWESLPLWAHMPRLIGWGLELLDRCCLV